MIKINDNDGKTKETAIKILKAKDHREGWEFIYNYMDKYQTENGFDRWDREDMAAHDEHGFLKELAVFKLFVNDNEVDEVWFDWTELFHVWDK